MQFILDVKDVTVGLSSVDHGVGGAGDGAEESARVVAGFLDFWHVIQPISTIEETLPFIQQPS